MINFTKRYHLTNRYLGGNLARRGFIRLGNFYHRVDTRINRKFLKIANDEDFYIKPLNNDVALEKGVEFFYECFVYAILITLPIYEMHRGVVASQKKTNDLNNRLKKMEEEISSTQAEITGKHKEINEFFLKLEKEYSSRHEKIDTMNHELDLKVQDLAKNISENEKSLEKLNKNLSKFSKDFKLHMGSIREKLDSLDAQKNTGN
jgi:cell division protein FtsL